ncbi:MAG: hypothetical protein A2665_00260 [Candidatus Zambryskibacteria bacterium RIFCSPHIGHO2_01_FULL_46_30]|uniref:Prealbumin-like fold domain-containing protein n=1 Tax=Candidatus Zambryskibacteria bacterium RIFCSPHIGHO2_01_FULL_46_30 TaxID=1802739 RepID=A0A1G2T4F7_9BACT|nr:MAG: hypothetical protein A2665_00260 [Candidatus Zambryskibacteria bacterium RIFCSPHIGHO2_01_FULL_46_30]OHB06300.1 MAG: hypothetical protein A3B22_00225 [Candidatus Zambryskibacteria bacterium RIFCSPLOWO2_01_FULL_47_33]
MSKMSNKIILGIVILATVAVGIYYFNIKEKQTQIACTMEAKLCPDGSAVGRTGSNCEFAPCPKVENIGSGGIQGKVLLGPICPVMREPPEEQCADRLFETGLVLTTSDGARIVKRFSSDAKGEFRVSLPPGLYLIRSAPGGPIMPSCSKGEVVEVKLNVYTETTVYCDTGIR